MVKPTKIALFTLLAIIFIDNLGVGVIYPLYPELFLNPEQGLLGIAASSREQSFYYGLTLLAFPIGNFFGTPFWGTLSDNIGRKPVLHLGLMLLAISHALSALAIMQHNYWIFLLARIAMGFAAGTFMMVQAVIADISAHTLEKLRFMGWPALAGTLGFIVGPLLSLAVLSEDGTASFHLSLPFWVSAILSVINITCLQLFFTETYIPHKAAVFSLWQQLSSFKVILRYKQIALLGITYFCYQFGYNNYYQSIALIMRAHFSASNTFLQIFYLVAGLATGIAILLVHPLTSYNFDIIKYRRVFGVILGACIGITSLFAVLFLQCINIVVICFTLLFLNISSLTLFSNAASKEEQGQIMGCAGEINSIAVISSSIVISILLGFSYKLLLLLSAVVTIIGMFLPLNCQRN